MSPLFVEYTFFCAISAFALVSKPWTITIIIINKHTIKSTEFKQELQVKVRKISFVVSRREKKKKQGAG